MDASKWVGPLAFLLQAIVLVVIVTWRLAGMQASVDKAVVLMNSEVKSLSTALEASTKDRYTGEQAKAEARFRDQQVKTTEVELGRLRIEMAVIERAMRAGDLALDLAKPPKWLVDQMNTLQTQLIEVERKLDDYLQPQVGPPSPPGR